MNLIYQLYSGFYTSLRGIVQEIYEEGGNEILNPNFIQKISSYCENKNDLANTHTYCSDYSKGQFVETCILHDTKKGCDFSDSAL